MYVLLDVGCYSHIGSLYICTATDNNMNPWNGISIEISIFVKPFKVCVLVDLCGNDSASSHTHMEDD